MYLAEKSRARRWSARPVSCIKNTDALRRSEGGREAKRAAWGALKVGYWRSGGCGGRSCLSAGRLPARSAAPPCRRWIGYKVASALRTGRFSHRELTSRRRRKGASPRSQYPTFRAPQAARAPQRSSRSRPHAPPPSPPPFLVTRPGAGPAELARRLLRVL